MDPQTTEVITTPDGVSVDMGHYNQPHFRSAVEDAIDEKLLVSYMKQGWTYDESITRQLYHKARMAERYPEGPDGKLFKEAASGV